MGAISIWSAMGQYNIAMCPMSIQASTLEVVGRGITDLRLLKGSLGRAETVEGIAT